MRKIKEVLRLKWAQGLSNRQIAKSCSVSRSTVADYLTKAEKAGLSWPLKEDLNDASIESMLFPNTAHQMLRSGQVPAMDYLHKELKRKGVTLQQLWYEYKTDNPEGYQYSQFCDLYKRWTLTLNVSLRQSHKAGEKLFIDYAGHTIPIVNSETGKSTKAQIFWQHWDPAATPMLRPLTPKICPVGLNPISRHSNFSAESQPYWSPTTLSLG